MYATGDSRKRYNGGWKKDLKHGRGVLVWKDGRMYVGNWKRNKRNGKGKLLSGDGGLVYEGFWRDNRMVGFTSSVSTTTVSAGWTDMDFEATTARVDHEIN